VDSLVRWREPAAFVAFGLLVANLVLITLAVLLDDGPVLAAAARLSYPAALPGLIVLLAMLVLSCVLGRTAHARLLTALSLVVTALAGLVAVALAVADLAVGGPSTLVELLPGAAALSVALVAFGLLVILLRRVSGAARREAPVIETANPDQPEPDQPPPEKVDPQQQPTWPTDLAAGAAWRTAGDAAAGAPATGWTGPDEAAGWGPAPESADPESVADEDLRPPVTDDWPPRRS
jgi:hypothetical protein